MDQYFSKKILEKYEGSENKDLKLKIENKNFIEVIGFFYHEFENTINSHLQEQMERKFTEQEVTVIRIFWM